MYHYNDVPRNFANSDILNYDKYSCRRGHENLVTFNAPRNRRSTEIDDDEPPITFTLPMAAAIPVKSDKILDLHPSCIYAFTRILVFQLSKIFDSFEFHLENTTSR